jgi:hypothetical protein
MAHRRRVEVKQPGGAREAARFGRTHQQLDPAHPVHYAPDS